MQARKSWKKWKEKKKQKRKRKCRNQKKAKQSAGIIELSARALRARPAAGQGVRVERGSGRVDKHKTKVVKIMIALAAARAGREQRGSRRRQRGVFSILCADHECE